MELVPTHDENGETLLAYQVFHQDLVGPEYPGLNGRHIERLGKGHFIELAVLLSDAVDERGLLKLERRDPPFERDGGRHVGWRARALSR